MYFNGRRVKEMHAEFGGLRAQHRPHHIAVGRVAGDAAALESLVSVKDGGPVAGLGRLHELGGRVVDALVVLDERLELRPEGLFDAASCEEGIFGCWAMLWAPCRMRS